MTKLKYNIIISCICVIYSTYAYSANGDLTVVNKITTTDLVVNNTCNLLPAGSLMMYSGSSIPANSGWLISDGKAVSRTTYATLFSVIGTTYGAGDGSTTFNLPDLRSRVIVGVGQGVGLANRTLGQKGGEENHVITIAEMPSHTHGVLGYAGPGTNLPYHINSAVNGPSSDYTGSQGANQPHNTMPPFIAMNYIIKY